MSDIAQYIVRIKFRHKESMEIEKYLKDRDYFTPLQETTEIFVLRTINANNDIEKVRSDVREAYEIMGATVNEVNVGILS